MPQLVESCFHITTKLIKKDITSARANKKNIDGYINISFGNTKTVADYCIEYGAENDYLVIRYNQNDQRFKIAESPLTFGPRSWFVCNCDRRVAKLYLPPNAMHFKCRHCHKLTYELTTFNRKSKLGQLSYKTNRTIKLMNMREKIPSMFYNGKFTLRFNRFLRLSESAGVKEVKEDAKQLLHAINME